METKSITAVGSKKHHRFTLNVQEDNTNISQNKSYLSFTFKISKYSGKYDWRSWGTAISYVVTIDTNTYTGYIPNYDGSSTVTLKSGSDIEITHNSDGTKTIDIAFSVTDTSGQTYTSGNASASDTMELTTLHTLPLITDISVVETNPFVEGIADLDMARYLSIKRYTLTAEAYDGATISKYRVYNGTELLLEKSSTDTNPNVLTVDYANVELQTNVYENTLYAVVVFEVEDSLGAIRNFSYDYYFPIIPYNLPNIITTSTNVKRNGQATGQVKLNLKGTFYNDTIGETTNDISIDFKYWVKGQSESSTYYGVDTSAIDITGNNIDITNWVMYKAGDLIEDVDKEYAYYFKFRLTDAFGKTSTSQVLCASGQYVMAKYKNRVDFMKITQQNNPIWAVANHDLTTDNYVVLDNGLAICWWQETINVAVNTSWGNNGYLSNDVPLSNFPITFAAPPFVFKSLDNVGYAGLLASANATPASTTNAGSVKIFRASSAAAQDYNINVMAIGIIASS